LNPVWRGDNPNNDLASSKTLAIIGLHIAGLVTRPGNSSLVVRHKCTTPIAVVCVQSQVSEGVWKESDVTVRKKEKEKEKAEMKLSTIEKTVGNQAAREDSNGELG